MRANRKILLVENYPPDRQRSMAQYADLLARAVADSGWRVVRWHPPVVFGRGGKTGAGLWKWLGYIDKYVMAPLWFRWRWRSLRNAGELPGLVHITDHSNAVYANCFRGAKVLVTCHDLIAVRRALGEFPVELPGIAGRLQQKWILRSLERIAWPGFVSDASKGDFIRLTRRTELYARWPVIYPAPAQALKPIDFAEAERRLECAGHNFPESFIHHHGGGTWYKNRETVLDVFMRCREERPELGLVFTGSRLTGLQRERLRHAGLLEACHDCGSVDTGFLEAVYNRASVFLFPSWCEGFGWPPVEAQACGCPVIASNAGSLKEVLGESALLFEPADGEGMTRAVLGVLTDGARAEAIGRLGLENTRRFTAETMTKECVDWYRAVMEKESSNPAAAETVR